MRPSIQEQLQYLSRTCNPNYLIIVQNKANEEMDFSQFRAVIPEKKEVYKPQLRYNIKTIDVDGMKLILVEDFYSNNRVVYECTCKLEHLEEHLEIARSKYKGTSIVDKINI